VAASGVPGFATGTVINRFVYTPYGESQTIAASWAAPATGSTPATPWSHLFQGLKLSDVTGLAYVRHRDYSPTLGRFIERDPIGFQAGDNNWYRFVANKPTTHVDPRGLFCGECQPPHPGFPNEYNKKFAGVRITPGGANPSTLDAGFDLLENLDTLDKIQSISSIITAGLQGSIELWQTALDEAGEWGADVSGLAPGSLEKLMGAWQNYMGVGVFIEVRYRSCDPCTCWNVFAGGGPKYSWQEHTKYHKCTQGTGNAVNPAVGIYGGNARRMPTHDNMTRCIQEALR
jgi:RHS repeat-associated protein